MLDALRAAIDDGLRLYPDPEARRAAGARRRRSTACPADHILVGNGSDELLALLLRATVDPGRSGRVPGADLQPLRDAGGGAGRGGGARRVSRRLEPAAGAGARPDARVTFVCNPNSPSGTVVPLDAIEALARGGAGCARGRRGLRRLRRRATRSASSGRCPNVLVLRTLSKSFSLAGLRCGLAFGHPELLAGLHTVRDSYNVNRLTQVGGRRGAGGRAPTMRANVARIRATRDAACGGDSSGWGTTCLRRRRTSCWRAGAGSTRPPSPPRSPSGASWCGTSRSPGSGTRSASRWGPTRSATSCCARSWPWL